MLASIELFLVSRFFFGLYAPHAFNFHLARPIMDVVRDRPLENLWRGGGRSTKKIFAQGRITRKKFMHWRHLILKYIHAMPLKKIHTRNLITKKNSCGSKIPLPTPITFLMVRPLLRSHVGVFRGWKTSSPKNACVGGQSLTVLQQGAHQRLNSKEHDEN